MSEEPVEAPAATPPAPKAVGAFTRAEAASRRFAIVAAAGVGSYLVGSGLSAAVMGAATEFLVSLDTDYQAFAVVSVIRRLWMLLLLPLAAWVAARIIEFSAWRFALLAAGMGEVLDLLLRTAMFGFDPVFESEELVSRAAGFTVGLGLVVLAARLGSSQRVRRDAAMVALAEKNRRDYEAAQAKQPPPTA